jgi:hypothetical protein
VIEVGVSHPSPEDGNRPSFRNVFWYLEFRMMDKSRNPVILGHAESSGTIRISYKGLKAKHSGNV